MTREDEDREVRERYTLGPKGKPVTVEQAIARAERAESQMAADYARGVADERARVVADLRAMAKGLRGITLFERNRLDKAADRYERGEHTKEST